MALVDLKNITMPELGQLLEDLGIPSSRAPHIFREIYLYGCVDIGGMAGLKGKYRLSLAQRCRISGLAVETAEVSEDGTTKFAFRLDDGRLIETVLIPQGERLTLCLSSQVGCAMACDFCLTGTMGLVRNLRPAEIVGQVLAVIAYLQEKGVKRATAREYINNLVFMGMGEPLANYDNLIAALKILMAPEGLEFTERRVTVSTCGLAPRIEDLGRDARVNLAISLHAADDETRSRLMPVNRSHNLERLLAACKKFPLARKRVILMEYILLAGINDSPEQARQLALLLQGVPCRVNLLPYNESAGLDYCRPGEEVIIEFKKILYQAGIRAFVRDSRGSDISAACGQLARGALPEEPL
ncbi:MAG: 23S rRNA (adenine(2503)-C(2))-methyltransferase RlmN [Thermodesulfobacteriota bacterium]